MRTDASPSDRLAATPGDVGSHVAGMTGQHLELGCRLTFDVRLDGDVLARAVRLLLDAEPVLGCAFVPGFRRAEWLRRRDLDTNIPFTVVESDDPDVDAISRQTLHIAPDGPQLHVTLLRGPTADEVVFTVSHDAADGQGAKLCAYRLAEIYTGLRTDASYRPAPATAARPSAEDVLSALTAQQMSAARKAPRMTMPNWEIPRIGATGKGRTLRELRLSPERFDAVKRYGAQRGATVNALALTAFFRAITRSFPPPAGRAMSLPFSADHRRYLPHGTPIPVTNLAVSLWLGVEHVPDEQFDSTLARVQEQLDAWKEALWGVGSLVQATALTRLGYAPTLALMRMISRASARSGKTSPVFTNIGVLDEDRLVFNGVTPVDARLSGPSAFGASLVPTISTYRDTLTVSMGLCEDDMDPATVEGILRDMGEELAACASA